MARLERSGPDTDLTESNPRLPDTGALLAESVEVALVVVLEPLVAIELTMQRVRVNGAADRRLSTS